MIGVDCDKETSIRRGRQGHSEQEQHRIFLHGIYSNR